ncbi:MAG: methyltransferase domain-containing protein [Alphaproteobacteria bacterium]|nr:methyltransferase domain-containing protein [Alphaproteobacteria bacterium]
MSDAPALLQIHVEVPRKAVVLVEAVFNGLSVDGEPPVVMSFEITGDRLWGVDAVLEGAADFGALRARLDETLGTLGMAPLELSVTELPPVDWVAESLKHHKPVRAGRFHVHGSHHERPARDRWSIRIDAGMAFGTGQHETTAGCLLALDSLARTVRVANPLDVGTGSGILAMAMAKAWPCRVLASDIDAEAIRVARENAADNGVGGRLDLVAATGLRHAEIRARAPYDLICANILARPLVDLAGGLGAALRPGGRLILSGFLRHQEAGVFAAYRNRGLRLLRRFPVGDWVTLMVGKG